MKKILSILLAVGICLSILSFTACSNGEHNYTCGVCNKEFSGGTTNSKSIIKTGMCSKCYKNYKWAIGE